MNLLQIKQKMFELGVSDKYMADACGVGVYYLKGIFNGCRPMTKKLNQKIEHVFNTLMIKPKSAEQPVEPVEIPKPKYAVDETGKLVDIEKNKLERDIEFYRGKVGGLFHSLDIIREQVKVQAPDATYATVFVMMLLDIVKELSMSTNDLMDAFEKRSK